MIEAFVDVFEQIPRGLVYVVMGVAVLATARVAQDLITPYRIQEQLNQKDNIALAVSISGYYLGVIIVFLGGLYQPFLVVADNSLGFTGEYWQDVGLVFVYSVVGIVVLNIARIIVDKLVLHDFSTEDEIINDHNAGTGAVDNTIQYSRADRVGQCSCRRCTGRKSHSDRNCGVQGGLRRVCRLDGELGGFHYVCRRRVRPALRREVCCR